MTETTQTVKSYLNDLYKDGILNADHTTSYPIRLSLSVLVRIVDNVRDRSQIWDDPLIVKWTDYISNHDCNLVSLMYRFNVLKHICSEPVVYHERPAGLLKCLAYMVLTEQEFYPLYDCTIWDRIDLREPVVTQLQILQPEIKQQCDALADRLDITDFRLQRDHASLSSYSLLYCLHLMCVMLKYETRLNANYVNLTFLEGTLYTINRLRGVLFHIPEE